DNAIPFLGLIVVVAVFGTINPNMFSAFGLFDLTGQMAEFGLLAIALTVVMISGGIDLSVGSIFALCVLTILTCLHVYGLCCTNRLNAEVPLSPDRLIPQLP